MGNLPVLPQNRADRRQARLRVEARKLPPQPAQVVKERTVPLRERQAMRIPQLDQVRQATGNRQRATGRQARALQRGEAARDLQRQSSPPRSDVRK